VIAGCLVAVLVLVAGTITGARQDDGTEEPAHATVAPEMPSGGAGDPAIGETGAEAADGATPGEPPIAVKPPTVAVNGLTATITVTATDRLPSPTLDLEVRNTSNQVVASGTLTDRDALSLELPGDRGTGPWVVRAPGAYTDGKSFELRAIAGWLTLLPPVIAILFALLLRQVVPALLAGIYIGAWTLHGGPLVGVLRAIDTYIVGAANSNRVSILIFSMLLAGMVGVISRSGGTIGLVEALTPYATDSRRGQVVTWILGILVFFDDYANTLLVGNTMRPVTDRLKVSREKLAYIVDSTAAPVASIALVSTWIGYEVSLIGSSLQAVGSDLEPYTVFLHSLPYNFYPVLALVFGLAVAASGRDFGPMLAAERRALGGKLLSDTAVPLADFEAREFEPPADTPRRWINAVAPVLVVLTVTFAGLWFTGRASLLSDGDSAGAAALPDLGIEGLGAVFGAGNSFRALLWGSLAGCVVALALAVGQRIVSFKDGVAAWAGGIKSLTVAIIILMLAWSIGDICGALNTSGFLVNLLSDALDPRLLPAVIFSFAAVTAFSTGTSWGAMGILIPLAVPTAHGLAQAAGMDAGQAHGILLGSVSAVLAGAIFGDHCSPISDTTVLSSMSSGCDHVDHVRTQLPYALVVAGVSLFVGYLPTGFGAPPWVGMLAGAACLLALIRWVGRPVRQG